MSWTAVPRRSREKTATSGAVRHPAVVPWVGAGDQARPLSTSKYETHDQPAVRPAPGPRRTVRDRRKAPVARRTDVAPPRHLRKCHERKFRWESRLGKTRCNAVKEALVTLLEMPAEMEAMQELMPPNGDCILGGAE